MALSSSPPDSAIVSAALDAPTGHPHSASAYWARLAPHLQHFGISRVADITGLDRVGLPVVQAVRPTARSNAVTQGKAMTCEAAAAGAVMECLEMAAGEETAGFAKTHSANLEIWRPLACGADWPNRNTPFVPAWDLSEDRPAAVPRDLISTDFAQGADAEAAPILRSSVGLGAGASPAAALMHGLLEAIEADARNRAEHENTMVRLELDTSDVTYGRVLGMAEAAGLRTAVWDMSRHGLPVVKASVMEAPGAVALPLPAIGYAARFSPAEAVAAAISEALQARLAVISGAREDITQRFYIHNIPQDALAQEWHRHAPVPAMRLHASSPPISLRQLARLVAPVFAVPLFYDDLIPLAITRVVAPGLIADPLRLKATP